MTDTNASTMDTSRSNHRIHNILNQFTSLSINVTQTNATQHNTSNSTPSSSVTTPQQYTQHKYVKKPFVVTVTGAAGNIAYSLLWLIGSGHMFGTDQPIELRLLEIPRMVKQLRSVIYELQDSNLPLIVSIIGTTDYKTAFNDCSHALLLGGKPKVPGIKRSQVLQANSHIFSAQGAALNVYANRDVKVCVLATPALTNALICQSNAPDIPVHSFTALTRLDCMRAKYQLASKIGCSTQQIKNVIIFGNGSKTQLPDVSQAYILDYPHMGERTSVRAAIQNDEWLSNEFIQECVDRGHNISKIKQKTSAGSAAIATCLHMRDWLYDTAPGEYVSMAVKSDGSYNVPKNIFFSFPVVCSNGQYEIVKGIQIDKFGESRLNATIKELQAERHEAQH